MADDWNGKVVVVTGGGSGLGVAMADRFTEAGAIPVLLDRDGAAAKAEAAKHDRGIGLEVDVGDPDALAWAAGEVRERFGPVHALCANVGVQQFGAIDALSRDDWRWVLDVNVLGMIATVDAFLPLLRAGEGARHIVLTSSSSFFTPAVRMAAYVVSKYAVTGYGEVLRRELAPEGINVALIFPGGMTTRHLETSAAARPETIGPWRYDRADALAMMEDAGMDLATHLTSAEDATAHLLENLAAGHLHIVTHGDYRDGIERQGEAYLAAFDRMTAQRAGAEKT